MSSSLTTLDAAVLAIYFAGVVALGLWVGRGQRNLSDYFLSGRDLPWWAVLLSIVATETSSVTFLSVPGKAFTHDQGDLRFLQITFGFIVGRLVVVWLLLPLYFRGELFTAYEVLQRRFGGATKRLASLVFLVTRNASDGLRLFLTAIVLQFALGWDLSASIALAGAVTIVYTLFGGMRSVVWTDCIQFVVYIAGAVFAGAVIVRNLPGGWAQLVEFGREHDKFRVFDFSFRLGGGPMTFWTGLLGGAFLSMGTHGADQLMVQRYLGARSQRDAARALAASGLVVCGQFALFLLIGVGLACFYDAHPPASPFARGDDVFPAFIVALLGPGAVGLVLAAVFSAAMSTLSGSLNSSATALLNDLVLPLLKSRPSDRHLLQLGRLATLLFGLVQIGVGIAAARLGMTQSVVDRVLSIAGFALGPILGLFFLGALSRRTTQRSALVGLLGGLAVVSCAAFSARIDGYWYIVIGTLATFLFGLAASYVVRSHQL